jgi:hypothetical protein
MSLATESAKSKDSVAVKSEPAPEYTKAQKTIYYSNQVGMLAKSDVVTYSFNRLGSLEPPLVDTASITIVDQDQDGKKNIKVDFLSGDNHIDVPVFEGFKLGNPILMIFLEHDVKVMSELTKGSTLYFRSRIRDGFASPNMAKVEPTTITIDQQKVDATMVTVKPYVGLKEIERFKQFEQKSYQFVISPNVPGGVYSIKTTTPSTDGNPPIWEEVLQYTSRSRT